MFSPAPALRRNGENSHKRLSAAAAATKTKLEIVGRRAAFSDQRSAVSLAFSIQLLNQRGQHFFDFDRLFRQPPIILVDQFQIVSQEKMVRWPSLWRSRKNERVRCPPRVRNLRLSSLESIVRRREFEPSVRRFPPVGIVW